MEFTPRFNGECTLVSFWVAIRSFVLASYGTAEICDRIVY